MKEVVSTWKEEIDIGNLMLPVFVYLQQAFEMVERVVLLDKLWRYEVRHVLPTWLHSYSNLYINY